MAPFSSARTFHKNKLVWKKQSHPQAAFFVQLDQRRHGWRSGWSSGRPGSL